MRWTKALIWGAGSLLAGCGGGGTTELSVEPPDPMPDVNPEPPDNTVVGPICPSCIMTGGETSDFDGGQEPCRQFLRTVAVSEGEVEAAGFDVAAYRDGLERSFEVPLRWTDLTATSALPRATPMAGYEPETSARGSVSTGSFTKRSFDTSTCADPEGRLQCASETGPVLDCGHVAFGSDVYTLEVSVELQTEDGAIDATLSGKFGLEQADPPEGGLAFGARAEAASVTGTLLVEPAPGANRGSIDLNLKYFDDAVRGRLELNFTNGWRELPGTGASPIDDRPLVAALQDDACPYDVLPAPLAEGHAVLGGQTPADVLEGLRSLIAQTPASAAWTHLGEAMTFDVAIENPEHACVASLRYDVETASAVGSKLVSLPVRLTSSDGLLDWSALATYELGDGATSLPHRLWFEQELTPASSGWHDAFSQFELAPHTDRIALRFAARYPVPHLLGKPESPRAVFEIFEYSGCPGNDLACQEEQAQAYAAACLVSPPGGECRPLSLLDRAAFF